MTIIIGFAVITHSTLENGDNCFKILHRIYHLITVIIIDLGWLWIS
jgi:hypothetical protein